MMAVNITRASIMMLLQGDTEENFNTIFTFEAWRIVVF
jgi:hypothetical protein